jgi:hypothetical protein
MDENFKKVYNIFFIVRDNASVKNSIHFSENEPIVLSNLPAFRFE